MPSDVANEIFPVKNLHTHGDVWHRSRAFAQTSSLFRPFLFLSVTVTNCTSIFLHCLKKHFDMSVLLRLFLPLVFVCLHPIATDVWRDFRSSSSGGLSAVNDRYEQCRLREAAKQSPNDTGAAGQCCYGCSFKLLTTFETPIRFLIIPSGLWWKAAISDNSL